MADAGRASEVGRCTGLCGVASAGGGAAVTVELREGATLVVVDSIVGPLCASGVSVVLTRKLWPVTTTEATEVVGLEEALT